MYRGRQLAGASFQPSAQVDVEKAAIGVWSSVPFTSAAPNRFEEIDPYGSYSVALDHQFSLAPGFEIYTYPASSPAVGSFHARYEPNLSLNYSAHGLRLTPTVYYDLTLEELTLELTAATALPLAAIGTEVDLTGTAGNYTANHDLNTAGPNEKSWGSYWLLGATLPYQIARGVKLSVGYAYTAGFDAHEKFGSLPSTSNPQAVGRGVFSASVAISF